MSKNKKILMMLAKGGASQSDIAAALHVSKRDVSAGAKAIREYGLTFDAISSMGADVVDGLFFPKEEREPNGAYLQPDMEPLVERKKKNRKLPVKLFWIEYCERAAADGKLAYAYQTFCEMFAEAAERMDATRHFLHEAGAKCYIDWAGDTAFLIAESRVNLVEQWIIGPAAEMTFYTIDEFNEFCAEKVAWLNSRPFTAKDGSRDLVFEEEERMHLMPLPAERYEICEWRSPKVAPDYHVVVDYMRYSVPHRLVGEQTDVKLTSSTVTVMHGGEVAAVHPRLHGRKGQYSTFDDHMPENHASLDNPWSPDRFTSWATRIGPETASAIGRVMGSRSIVEQSFVSCRNILGLSKTYAPELLERACAKMNATGALPSYTGLKNAILAIKASDAEVRANGKAVSQPAPGVLVDRAKSAGRLRGADAYKRGGE